MTEDPFHSDLVAHMPALRRYALRLCRDGSRADDLVQETLLRALTCRDQFEAGTNLTGWVMTILHNYFCSLRRRAWRTVEDPDSKIARSRAVDPDQLPHMEAIDLVASIDRLPKQYREAILLRVDGGTYEDIAAAKHVASGTVKSRIARARAMLEAAQ